jgi:hypothetical protein
MTEARRIDIESLPEATFVVDSAEGRVPFDPEPWAKFGDLLQATRANGSPPDFDRLADSLPPDVL